VRLASLLQHLVTPRFKLVPFADALDNRVMGNDTVVYLEPARGLDSMSSSAWFALGFMPTLALNGAGQCLAALQHWLALGFVWALSYETDGIRAWLRGFATVLDSTLP
jgi:hypothetical protein